MKLTDIIKPGTSLEVGHTGSAIVFHSNAAVAAVTEAGEGLVIALADGGEVCIDHDHGSRIERDEEGRAYSLLVDGTHIYIRDPSSARLEHGETPR
jgi:hypothetical protein